MANNDNPWEPIEWPFRYKPHWEGPLPGRYFEKQTEDALNALRTAIDEANVAVPSDVIPKAAGVAAPGIATEYSRGDHVHPAQTTISGNAGSATKLKNSRAIALTGDATGESYFDGTANIQIETEIDPITDAQIDALFPGSGGGGGTLPYVDLASDQEVGGAKVFAEGPYGTAHAVSAALLDLNYGCVFTKTVSADITFAITGVPAGAAATFTFLLTNGGSATVTWPASVKWADDTAPDLTADGTDVLAFVTANGGVTWFGTVAVYNA